MHEEVDSFGPKSRSQSRGGAKLVFASLIWPIGRAQGVSALAAVPNKCSKFKRPQLPAANRQRWKGAWSVVRERNPVLGIALADVVVHSSVCKATAEDIDGRLTIRFGFWIWRDLYWHL